MKRYFISVSVQTPDGHHGTGLNFTVDVLDVRAALGLVTTKLELTDANLDTLAAAADQVRLVNRQDVK